MLVKPVIVLALKRAACLKLGALDECQVKFLTHCARLSSLQSSLCSSLVLVSWLVIANDNGEASWPRKLLLQRLDWASDSGTSDSGEAS
jgi:hypothetical protein